ncbi:MAG: hypothetical protein Q7S22_09035 [Candidatus Micrarchaeota archaeon]|nr:hypothetical protein [Candidatus Micrarchaeota archaeon]
MVENIVKKGEEILTGMKNAGIAGAVIRRDGITVFSTIALSETGPNIFSSIANICDAISKEIGDKQKEIEISMSGLFFVIIPVDSYLFCGAVKDREQKKTLREYSEKFKQGL